VYVGVGLSSVMASVLVLPPEIKKHQSIALALLVFVWQGQFDYL